MKLPLIGTSGQSRIRMSKVLVIGAGGLGCPVIQYLAGAGVGRLGILDHDRVSKTDLHRQVIYREGDTGKNKAVIAGRWIQNLNSDVDVHVFPEKLSATNALDIIREFDVVADCTDNFTTRLLINDACVINDKPFVSASVFRNEYQLSIFNYHGGPTYRCLFPEKFKPGTSIACSDSGVLGPATGMIGSMQAIEVIKLILNDDHVLSGKILYGNVIENRSMIVHAHRNESVVEEVLQSKDNFKELDYSAMSESGDEFMPDTISASEALGMDDVQWVDVRELHEHPRLINIVSEEIPLSQFENNLDRLDSEETVVVFCQSGVRSLKACQILHRSGFKKIKNVGGGAEALSRELLVDYEY